MSDDGIIEFLNKINLTDYGDYYIKVRDSYMTPETQLINVDSERTIYLNNMKSKFKTRNSNYELWKLKND